MALPGMRERSVATSRLQVHIREAGTGPIPVIFLHGNCSSGVFYEELMLSLPDSYRAIAPDLRGYGQTQPLPIDATRGCADWADDLHALVEALDVERFHLVGWSMGGGIVMRYALDHADRLLSVVLINPVSPYGFGGTKDAVGTLASEDFAGTGGGTVNPDFVKALQAGDRSADGQTSPRNVINSFYFKPPFRGTPEQEERWVDSVLSTRVGDDFYPGDFTPSANWPGVAPGTRGVLNTMSPKYHHVEAFKDLATKPPVLWVRGDTDQIVSDTSFYDLAYLGSLGFVPGWPGTESCPPQPMIAQTRHVLDQFRANGGTYEEAVIEGSGHSPFVEQPDRFKEVLFRHLTQTSR